jgi:photosystem II biogenesis protein Psp29
MVHSTVGTSVSACLTVADSKRAFHQAFPYVIGPLYRRMVDELLVELHLLSRQKGFHSDALFAVGLTQVFDSFARGYRPEQHKELLFEALCSSAGFDAARMRSERDGAMAAVGQHTLQEVRQWLVEQGEGAPEPLASVLAGVRRPDFHYSRLFAVGLLALLQQARGAEALEPQALRQAAHEIGEAMGLIKDRVDKDLNLYVSNLEKMAQAVELMEETVAAERRRRERQDSGGVAVAPPPSGGDEPAPAPAAALEGGGGGGSAAPSA